MDPICDVVNVINCLVDIFVIWDVVNDATCDVENINNAANALISFVVKADNCKSYKPYN